ncbi:MAG: hypothetical protein WA172_19265 [Terriglobales bacterium]
MKTRVQLTNSESEYVEKPSHEYRGVVVNRRSVLRHVLQTSMFAAIAPLMVTAMKMTAEKRRAQ